MNKFLESAKEAYLKIRFNFCYLFIGTNRTGKSSIARKQIEVWKKANPDKLVVGFDPQRRFTGLIDIKINPENENWLEEILQMRNILLVIDDFKKLHESSHAPKGLKTLMIDFCDYNIDMIFIFHNPSDIWDCLNSHATHYFIFKTNSREGKFKDKIPNYQLCLIASYKVNQYVREFGRGVYPKFPYMFVDTDNQTLTGINMNNKSKIIKK